MPVQWWLHQFLTGAMGRDEIPAAVASWSQFFIYQGAREIVLMPTRDERMAALDKIPSKVRPYVEAEVKELWPLRRSL